MDVPTQRLTRQHVLRLIAGTLSAACAGGSAARAVARAAKPAEAASPTEPAEAASAAAPPANASPVAVEVAPGVHVARGVHGLYTPANHGDISNKGFVIGEEAVAVIDTGGTALVGAALRAQIRALTDKPIRYVVNTHMHPDHVLGNAAFKADSPAFIGHHKLAAALAARAERYLAINGAAVGAADFAGTEIVLPTESVAGTRVIDLGGRRLTLTAHATAHTDNDLTVLDEATGTLFTGDLIFSGHVPTIDGSIRGWISLLRDLSGRSFQRIVPGHGPAAMAWPAAGMPVLEYLEAVATDVRAAIRAGHSMVETIPTAAQSQRAGWELFDEFHARNVSAAFAELEWE